MNIQKLKYHLDKLPFEKILLGYRELHFVQSKSIDKQQVGYRIDLKEYSLISENGKWKTDWYRIAWDDLGDPHFIDLSSGNIYTAVLELDAWSPRCIATSFEAYEKILNRLKEISIGREYPRSFKNNPVPLNEVEKFKMEIQQENKDIDIDYWELFLLENE